MRAAPRFVPTLTEVVAAPAGAAASTPASGDPTPASAESTPASGDSAALASPVWGEVGAAPLPMTASSLPSSDAAAAGGSDLQAWVEAEVAESLRRNLHDLIANALVEQIDDVAARLRGDIEPMIRRAVREALANDAAARAQD